MSLPTQSSLLPPQMPAHPTHSPSNSYAGSPRDSSHGNSSPNNTNHSNSGAPVVAKERQQVIGGRYFLGDPLGKSLFGVVFQGLNSDNGEFVAVKQIPLDDIETGKVENVMKEIAPFKKLEHPNIVRVFDAIQKDQYLYLVLELVEGGSVVLMKESVVNIPESLIAKYIWKCLKGLQYLHKNKIVHNDIKGVNILTTRDGQVKLADCVQPKLNQSKSVLSVVQPFWMAPEVIRNNQATPASDVWSLGCTVIELLTGSAPYSNLPHMSAIIQITKDDHPPIPDIASPELAEFLLHCLEKDPNKRYTVEQLLELPWIKNVRKDEEDEPSHAPILSDEDHEQRGILKKSRDENPEDPTQGDEEHLTLKVHLSDLADIKHLPIPSVMLFVFQDTHAAAMVDVALRKAGVSADANQYCLVEIDNVTGEERRFNDFDLPKLEAEVLWQFEGEIRFSIKKKGPWVKEGVLQRKTKKGYQSCYYVLDLVERYFAGYPERPNNRDEELATHVVFGFHLIKWAYISDEIENCFVIRYHNHKEDYFTTDSYGDMISWLNEIRYACDIHFLFDEED